jgi:type II secretion system protein G
MIKDIVKENTYLPIKTVRFKNNHAFTLIELLVVVLIIGILAAIALPQYFKAVEKAKAQEAISTLQEIKKASDFYQLQNGPYPTSMESLYIDFPNGVISTENFQGNFYSAENGCVTVKDYVYCLNDTPYANGKFAKYFAINKKNNLKLFIDTSGAGEFKCVCHHCNQNNVVVGKICRALGIYSRNAGQADAYCYTHGDYCYAP